MSVACSIMARIFSWHYCEWVYALVSFWQLTGPTTKSNLGCVKRFVIVPPSGFSSSGTSSVIHSVDCDCYFVLFNLKATCSWWWKSWWWFVFVCDYDCVLIVAAYSKSRSPAPCRIENYRWVCTSTSLHLLKSPHCCLDSSDLTRWYHG